MSAVIAEKQLDYFDGEQRAPAFVRVLAPEPDGQDWRCQYQMEWPGYVREFGLMGVDSLQALALALQIIPETIGATEDFKSGRIGAYGERLNSVAELREAIGIAPMKSLQ